MTDLIADYERHLKRLDRAESTIESYLETLRRMDRELPAGLTAAVPDELEAWLFDNDWSAATRHLRRAAITGFFAFASSPKRRVHLDWNPAADLTSVRVPRGRPRPAPETVVADIIVRARQPYRDWFVIAAFAGARCIEISNLDRQHIGEEETLLHGKGDKTRAVPTHPLLRELAAQLPDGPVAADRGARLDRRAVSRRANWNLRQLGHTITMHWLRSRFGTRAFDECLDIMAVKDLLGHASVSTTQVYIAPSRANMARAVAGLPVPATR